MTRVELPTKHPPEGHLRGVRQTVQKKRVTARPESTWPEECSSMSKNSQRKAINRCAEEESKLDVARGQRGIYCFLDDGLD